MICVGWLEGVWAVWGMWHKQQRRASHFLLPHPKFPGFRSGHWGTFFRTFAPPPLLNPLPSRTFTPRPAGHWGSRGGERRCWPLGYTSHLGGRQAVTAGSGQEGHLSQSQGMSRFGEGGAGSTAETQLPSWPPPGASGAQQR